jgi:peptidoglycan/xylan/chitin deacetylase (PgdA/CDA1 family)
MTSQPLVIMYHGVPSRSRDRNGIDAIAFVRQIEWLRRWVEFVHPDETARVRRRSKPRVLLTFDDGFLNHQQVVAPILAKHSIPALFFVPTRHGEPGGYLWFSYLRMLFRHFPRKTFAFRGEIFDMDGHRRESVQRLRCRLFAIDPHPSGMYAALRQCPPLEEFVSQEELLDECAGLSGAEVAELFRSDLFVPGVHTVDHPLLTRCSPDEMSRQIRSNKDWLEMASGKPCTAIAYPGGDYDSRVIQCSQNAGLTSGYAILPRSRADGRFGIARSGIYSPSLPKLGVKLALSRWIPLDRLPRPRRSELPV